MIAIRSDLVVLRGSGFAKKYFYCFPDSFLYGDWRSSFLPGGALCLNSCGMAFVEHTKKEGARRKNAAV